MQGAFRADVLLGSKQKNQFCIVEFEPGKEGVIFKKKPTKYPEWSARFEHAFSQMVDWFCSLADQRKERRLYRHVWQRYDNVRRPTGHGALCRFG